MFLLIAAYSCQSKNTIDLELKVPEAMIINSSEFIQKIEKLKLQRSAGSNEELVKVIFESREVIDDEQLINEIFKEINSLKARIIRDKNYKPSHEILFSFDLIDNKERGVEGTSYKNDLRYIIVAKDKSIVIPLLTEDGKSVFFAKAKISQEFFNKLKALEEVSVK
ncbi:hypothetical protein [Zhaonella formicivorans]|uniref:hypothetical protein n=1 Tax=Zhaonella formicivorans TaxID=2528593 RepID=UPI001D11D0CC|nr:hypothetical protein [Zhaonella formicivorans]